MHGAAHEARALSRELPFTAVERRLTPTLTAEPAQILPPTSLSLISSWAAGFPTGWNMTGAAQW